MSFYQTRYYSNKYNHTKLEFFLHISRLLNNFFLNKFNKVICTNISMFACCISCPLFLNESLVQQAWITNSIETWLQLVGSLTQGNKRRQGSHGELAINEAEFYLPLVEQKLHINGNKYY